MRKYLLYTASLLTLFTACSDSEQAVVEPPTGEALMIGAGYATTVEVQNSRATRADEPDLSIQKFDLFVNQKAPTTPAGLTGHKKYNAEYKSGAYKISSDTEGEWYWDDKGGYAAQIDLLGIAPKSSAITPENSSNLTQFTWSVVTDQSAGITASDLLISNRVVAYTLEKQKKVKAELEFKHAFSKLTFILNKGTGFKVDGSDFNPSIKTVELFPTATVAFTFDADDADNDNMIISTSGTKAAVTPFLITEKNSKDTKVLEAIVLPGQQILKGADFATVTIPINGIDNSYKVKLPNEADDKDITFESGKNYEFTITVNKTDAQVSVSLIPWSDGASVTREVTIGVTGEELLDNKDVEDGASLYFKITKDTELTGLRRKTTFSITGTEPDLVKEWTDLSPILYWDDVPNGAVANAILINAGSDTDPNDIYVGKTTIANNTANKYLNFKDMQHPFSRVDIKIRTQRGVDEKVDLTKLTNITFINTVKQFDNINLDMTTTNTNFQEITYKSGGDESAVTPVISGTLETEEEGTGTTEDPIITYEYYEQLPIYIEPVTIAKDAELLKIAYENGGVQNKYPLKLLNQLVFAANKTYDIVITLKKTEIAEVGVSIKPWEPGTSIGGGSTIKD